MEQRVFIMSKVTLHDIDKILLDNLNRKAESDGLSIEDEIKAILTRSVLPTLSKEESINNLLIIRDAYAHRQLSDSVDLIREDRDR